jgi:hypothetical protein
VKEINSLIDATNSIIRDLAKEGIHLPTLTPLKLGGGSAEHIHGTQVEEEHASNHSRVPQRAKEVQGEPGMARACLGYSR